MKSAIILLGRITEYDFDDKVLTFDDLEVGVVDDEQVTFTVSIPEEDKASSTFPAKLLSVARLVYEERFRSGRKDRVRHFLPSLGNSPSEGLIYLLPNPLRLGRDDVFVVLVANYRGKLLTFATLLLAENTTTQASPGRTFVLKEFAFMDVPELKPSSEQY